MVIVVTEQLKRPLGFFRLLLRVERERAQCERNEGSNEAITSLSLCSLSTCHFFPFFVAPSECQSEVAGA